jgi:1-deoxyxylulose-5-phosphate synthase
MNMDPWVFRPRRALGRTGFVASALGIGDVADRSLPRGELLDTLCRALDTGLNVIDTAPSYEDGFSEELVGDAVRGRRDAVFVIDKIDFIDQPVVPQVEGSLRRLSLHAADAFVFHAVPDLATLGRILAPAGPMEQLRRCAQAGKLRFCGISSHDPDVLIEAMVRGACDIAMFAVGPCCDDRYLAEVLPLARERNVGTVCFKTFGAGMLLGDTSGYNRPLNVPAGAAPEREPRLPRLSVSECISYTLTCDPDVALLGLSAPEEQDIAFAAAWAFCQLDVDQMENIRHRALRAIEGKGRRWWDPPA